MPIVSDILTFFTSNSRGENDAVNRVREEVLALLAATEHPFYHDADYGEKWLRVRQELCLYIRNYLNPECTHWTLEHKGGLWNHHDFNLTLHGEPGPAQDRHVALEFKHNSMPQFMQESDRRAWTDRQLAEFWYDEGWLDRIRSLYPQPLTWAKPSREEYLKGVNMFLTAKSPPSFFKQFHHFDHDRDHLARYKAKTALSKAGIAAFLKRYGSTFRVDRLRAKCQAEQAAKVYLIWKPKQRVFAYDRLTPEELSPTAVKTVTKNTVVLGVAAANAELHCLLRWKNTMGICNPMWQIRLKRL